MEAGSPDKSVESLHAMDKTAALYWLTVVNMQRLDSGNERHKNERQ